MEKKVTMPKKHKVNCAVPQKSCSFCQDKDIAEYCDFCHQREHIVMGDGCQERFCEWLFGKENHKYTVFAHNFRVYDGYFLVDYAHRKGYQTNLVENGGKIIMLEVKPHKMKFLDFTQFHHHSSAKKFPKRFGVTELKKGYFSHLFNVVGNQDYNGKIPDKEFFYPDGMSSSERVDFVKEYDVRTNDTNYNFKDEIKAYCRSDVDTLHKCILIFRRLFIESTGTDPFAVL